MTKLSWEMLLGMDLSGLRIDGHRDWRPYFGMIKEVANDGNTITIILDRPAIPDGQRHDQIHYEPNKIVLCRSIKPVRRGDQVILMVSMSNHAIIPVPGFAS